MKLPIPNSHKVNETDVMTAWGLYGQVLKHISEVDSGRACGCICPDCGDPLVARKGNVNEHHFAHLNQNPQSQCGESALHRIAKDVFGSMTHIRLPDKPVDIPYDDGLAWIKCDDYEINRVMTEQRRANYIPDVTLIGPSMAQLDVEIKVSHGVDEIKAGKVKVSGVDMMEIDLSKYKDCTLNYDQLKEAIASGAPRVWVHTNIAVEVSGVISHTNQYFQYELEVFKRDQLAGVEYLYGVRADEDKAQLRWFQNRNLELTNRLTATDAKLALIKKQYEQHAFSKCSDNKVFIFGIELHNNGLASIYYFGTESIYSGYAPVIAVIKQKMLTRKLGSNQKLPINARLIIREDGEVDDILF